MKRALSSSLLILLITNLAWCRSDPARLVRLRNATPAESLELPAEANCNPWMTYRNENWCRASGYNAAMLHALALRNFLELDQCALVVRERQLECAEEEIVRYRSCLWPPMFRTREKCGRMPPCMDRILKK